MSVVYLTPEEAERAFYRAFETADVQLMMSVWAKGVPISCIHPGAPRIDDRPTIEESWRQIFHVSGQLTFHLTEVRKTTDEQLAVHLIREAIEVEGELVNFMATTNIYRFNGQGWQMIVHHASPEPSLEEGDEEDDDDPELSWDEDLSPKGRVLH